VAVCCFDTRSFPGEGWRGCRYCLSEAAKMINRKAATLKKNVISSLEGTLMGKETSEKYL